MERTETNRRPGIQEALSSLSTGDYKVRYLAEQESSFLHQEDCIVEFGEPGWRWLRTMWDFQAQGGLALEVDDGNGPDPVVT